MTLTSTVCQILNWVEILLPNEHLKNCAIYDFTFVFQFVSREANLPQSLHLSLQINFMLKLTTTVNYTRTFQIVYYKKLQYH